MSDYGHNFVGDLVKNFWVVPPVVILLFIGIATIVHVPRVVIQEIENRYRDIGEISDTSEMKLS